MYINKVRVKVFYRLYKTAADDHVLATVALAAFVIPLYHHLAPHATSIPTFTNIGLWLSGRLDCFRI